VFPDFQRLCVTDEIRFAEALLPPHSPVARRLLKMLGKIGLSFDMGRITIQDNQKWRSVSMMERVAVKLPSTSNRLESFHGHGNEATPRRNEFIPSLARIASMMIRKMLSFRTALEDNFGVMIRIARGRAKHSDPALLASERSQYGTPLQYCRCGETCYLSALYRITCPCSHQYSLGAANPDVPELYLDLHNPMEELKFVVHFLERPEVAAPSNPDKW
jgi:hypothetical protein